MCDAAQAAAHGIARAHGHAGAAQGHRHAGPDADGRRPSRCGRRSRPPSADAGRRPRPPRRRRRPRRRAGRDARSRPTTPTAVPALVQEPRGPAGRRAHPISRPRSPAPPPASRPARSSPSPSSPWRGWSASGRAWARSDCAARPRDGGALAAARRRPRSRCARSRRGTRRRRSSDMLRVTARRSPRRLTAVTRAFAPQLGKSASITLPLAPLTRHSVSMKVAREAVRGLDRDPVGARGAAHAQGLERARVGEARVRVRVAARPARRLEQLERVVVALLDRVLGGGDASARRCARPRRRSPAAARRRRPRPPGGRRTAARCPSRRTGTRCARPPRSRCCRRAW